MCNELGLKFYIFDCSEHNARNHTPDYVASIVFDKDIVLPENIIELVNKLYDIGFILKK